MTRKEALSLNNELHGIKKLKGREVLYAISLNKTGLDPIMKAIQEQQKDLQDIAKEYNDERVELVKSFATVNGEVKYKSKNQFDVPEEKLPELEKKIEELKVKHKGCLDKQQEEAKAFDRFMDGDSGFTPILIKKHDIPEDLDDVSIMDTLLKIVKKPD